MSFHKIVNVSDRGFFFWLWVIGVSHAGNVRPDWLREAGWRGHCLARSIKRPALHAAIGHTAMSRDASLQKPSGQRQRPKRLHHDEGRFIHLPGLSLGHAARDEPDAGMHIGDHADADRPVSLSAAVDLLRQVSQLHSRQACVALCHDVANALERLTVDGDCDRDAAFHLRRNLGLSNKSSADLLIELARAPDHLRSHDELIAALQTTAGTLKVYVCAIRTRFKALGLDDPIMTVWGEGYMMSDIAAAYVRSISRSSADAEERHPMEASPGSP